MSRDLRVFWVTRTFDLGGAERALLELLPYLTEAGIAIEPLAVAGQGGRVIPLLREAGLRPRVLGAGPLDPGWVWRLRGMLKRERPHLMHLHDPLPGAGGRLASLGTGIPVVHTEHGRWEASRLLSRWANALTYGMNDATIAVSGEVRDSVARRPFGGAKARRMRTITNGVDLERVRRDAEPEPDVDVPVGSFGMVGHLTRVKGPDVLVRAAAVVQRALPGHPCVVVGGGPLEGELRSIAGDTGADVRFTGSRIDARAICARLSVYVQPSRSEGLPLAVLEAMTLGRPVVATAVGGIPEVLTDGIDALLVPPADPDALAGAILRILAEPSLADRLGRAARETAKTHDARDRAAELVEVYEGVLAA